MSIFIEILTFFLSLLILTFLPGYFLISAIFKKKSPNLFLPIEKLIISFALSLIIFDFLMILLGRLGFNFNKVSILTTLSTVVAICYLYIKLPKKEKTTSEKIRIKFNRNQTILIILTIFLTIFIKTAYLKDSIFPTSTDLGHHMYWSKLISETGHLPHYAKKEIAFENESFEMESEEIADFIIGEHLIFSGIHSLTNIDFISYFPIIVLFLINIFGILAIFILSLRLFENFSIENKFFNSVNLSIITLFLSGPIYAIASPQAKFISGGVIGNMIGNLLIPICLYFFFRAIKEKDRQLMLLGLFFSAGIFYTHHLSGFIFIFILIFTLLFFNLFVIIQNIKFNSFLPSIKNAYKKLIQENISTILNLPVLSFLILSIGFVLFVYTPSYLETNAQSTVVGAPSKSTRAGLNWEQFKYSVGELRLILGIIGSLASLVIILIKKNKSSVAEVLAVSVLFGWSISISLMSLKPHWLHINIPSDRVANYANFPFLISASFGILILFYLLNQLKKERLIKASMPRIIFGLLFLTLIFQGFYENSQSLSDNSKNQKALQTFHASSFLAEKLKSEDLEKNNFLKDHNYISGDSWIKLFFMKDYNYPLSRGYFKRYEDVTKPREMCTLWMIGEPSSDRSLTCFDKTDTRFILVDTTIDGPQFQSNPKFWKIYESGSLSIFYKKDK